MLRSASASLLSLPCRLLVGALWGARHVRSIMLTISPLYQGFSLWRRSFRAPDPVGQRFPLGIVLRHPVLAARVKLGAAGLVRERHQQQAALRGDARQHHARRGFEVLTRF